MERGRFTSAFQLDKFHFPNFDKSVRGKVYERLVRIFSSFWELVFSQLENLNVLQQFQQDISSKNSYGLVIFSISLNFFRNIQFLNYE